MGREILLPHGMLGFRVEVLISFYCSAFLLVPLSNAKSARVGFDPIRPCVRCPGLCCLAGQPPVRPHWLLNIKDSTVCFLVLFDQRKGTVIHVKFYQNFGSYSPLIYIRMVRIIKIWSWCWIYNMLWFCVPIWNIQIWLCIENCWYAGYNYPKWKTAQWTFDFACYFEFWKCTEKVHNKLIFGDRNGRCITDLDMSLNFPRVAPGEYCGTVFSQVSSLSRFVFMVRPKNKTLSRLPSFLAILSWLSAC